MARIRSVHPSLFTDEAWVSCSPLARILYIGLWTDADDQGLFEWKPLQLKMRLLPGDGADAGALLGELASVDLIKPYDHDGRRFGAIKDFRKFQRPQKPNAIHPITEAVREYVSLPTPISDADPEPVCDQSATDPVIPPQMEDGGGRGRGEETTEANAPVVLARPSRTDVARGFLAFWSAYPRRVGKDAAAKAFAKALPRIDDPDPLAVILAGIERALPGWDDPQFIPHPSTWLTQGRWADDAPEPRENRNDRPSSSNRPGSSYAQPSRAERDQSAALRVLAARGALPGQGEGGRVHDLGPARPAAAGG